MKTVHRAPVSRFCRTTGIPGRPASPLERVALRESGGRITGEYIYIYPPGIPIVAPGEEISGEALDLVLRFMEQGLPVQGPQDRALEWLLVVRQNIDR